MQWHPMTEKPKSGSRVIAVFGDRSGATMFWVHDDGVMDNDGQEGSSISAEAYEIWAYLPDDYRIWIEDNLDD